MSALWALNGREVPRSLVAPRLEVVLAAGGLAIEEGREPIKFTGSTSVR